MCGGPSDAQKQQQQLQLQSAQTQNRLGNTLADAFQTSEAKTVPFYTQMLDQGLPYFDAQSQYSTSDMASQINQAKAAQKAKLAGYGAALPSGFAESADRDLSAQGARMFDENQLNLLQQQQAAKERGAAGLNPLGTAQTAGGVNSSVMDMRPLPSNTFWQNLIGGVLGAAGNIPFAFA